MNKETFRELFKEAIKGHEEEDYAFQDFFKKQVKESIKEMFRSGELSIDVDIEHDYYDSEELIIEVKMDRDIVHRTECRIK